MALSTAGREPPKREGCDDQGGAAFNEEEVLPAREVVLDLEDTKGDETREGT
ncbi:hypothetical protein ACMYSQ_006303 [Aspergillus niger]